MSPNRMRPHVVVYPEDDANHIIALEFVKHLPAQNARWIQIFPVGGGWLRTLKKFMDDCSDMMIHDKRRAVLCVDFDNHAARRAEITNKIPESLQQRVYVLGSLTNPEALVRNCGMNYSEIGECLASECKTSRYELWENELLKHNAAEMARLRRDVYSLLFAEK